MADRLRVVRLPGVALELVEGIPMSEPTRQDLRVHIPGSWCPSEHCLVTDAEFDRIARNEGYVKVPAGSPCANFCILGTLMESVPMPPACDDCDGTGELWPMGEDSRPEDSIRCPSCGGTGTRTEDT